MALGITNRLLLSFSAVAVLAAAANLIAEDGVEVIRTRHTIPRRPSLGAQPQPEARTRPPPQPAETAAAPAQLPIASPVIDTITTTAPNDRERRMVGWITAAVLAVILMVSVWTVLSIVIPVRRMIRATKKIADGELDGGGLKELDT